MKKKIQKVKKKIVNSVHIIKMVLMTAIIISVGSLIFNTELVRLFSKVHKIFESTKQIDKDLEFKIKKITKDYPIEAMATEIAKQDEEVAAFLVAIAKKESGWGNYTPKYKGKECYNYWGFRRKRLLMGSGGHTCFDNPVDAVNTVANRIEDLIAKGIDTPREMVIWKCGSRCSSDRGARKWIADVRFYYNKMTE